MKELTDYFCDRTIVELKALARNVEREKMKKLLTLYKYTGANAPYCIRMELYKEKFNNMNIDQLRNCATQIGVSTTWRENKYKSKKDLVESMVSKKVNTR